MKDDDERPTLQNQRPYLRPVEPEPLEVTVAKLVGLVEGLQEQIRLQSEQIKMQTTGVHNVMAEQAEQRGTMREVHIYCARILAQLSTLKLVSVVAELLASAGLLIASLCACVFTVRFLGLWLSWW
jgi:hypothetical protein